MYDSESCLVVEVKSKHHLHLDLMELNESFLRTLNESFSLRGDGVFRYKGRLCVPDVDGFRDRILEETHVSRYSILSESTKMYHDLREICMWGCLKWDIAKFVPKCSNCHQVKAEHLKSGVLL